MFLVRDAEAAGRRRDRRPRLDAGRRRRRLRGQHRMAEGILGRGRRQFPDPRHALQPRLDPEDAARQGRAGDRRSHAVPCGRDRRARAEIRRRHHHAARLRGVRHRRQQARAALLRRGRGHLAEALRDLGPAGRGAARPDRLHHLRLAVVVNSFMPTLFPPIEARRRSRELAGKLELDPAALEKTIADFNAAVRPGTFDHTILDDCRTEGLDAAEDALGAAIETRAVLRLSGAARHHLHLSRHPREQAGAHADEGRQARPPTCSPPARSWPATCSARAMRPASA